MKPPLLLLCGLLCDETVWADIPARLAAVADVSIVPFRGFDSLAAMAEHVLGVAPPRFALAGHSMGGRVALEVFRRASERVSAIALLNTGVQPVRHGEAQSRGWLLKSAYERGMHALAGEWLPPMLGKNYLRKRDMLQRLGVMIENWTADDYAGQVKAMLQRPEAWSILSHIDVPTLLLSGSEDAWAPLSQLEMMHRHVPHATLFEVHDAGHMAPIERPDAVALALREWLGQSM
jgi:pimeloyl-ACP methyl ester carboxylesterase